MIPLVPKLLDHLKFISIYSYYGACSLFTTFTTLKLRTNVELVYSLTKSDYHTGGFMTKNAISIKLDWSNFTAFPEMNI